MDPVSELDSALGAEILRCNLLGRAPPKIGERYHIERILGRGASALVVAALDDRLNRPVALKLRPARRDSAMLAEARTLARLDHPNVVRVHDVDVVQATLDGRDFSLWLVSMARIEGRPMRAWLREAQRPHGEILAICIDVARGLAAAHEARIVHRDVKPDNVVVRSDGVAQILDFGLAVQSASSTLSDVGDLRPAAGTDPYMAPEARLGRTSRKSDQYSLGVALVEALTGAPVPAGRRSPAGVSHAVWKIARRATSPDPEDRFDDMTAMASELAHAARPPAPRRVVWWLLAVIALMGAGTVAATVSISRPDDPSMHLAPAPLSAQPIGARTIEPVTHAPVDTRLVNLQPRPDAGRARTPDASRPNAGERSDAGSTRLARSCSLPRSGRWRFVATGDVDARRYYELRIDNGSLRHVILRKMRRDYRSGLDRLDLSRTRPSWDGECWLTIEALADPEPGRETRQRRYLFRLQLDGDAAHGAYTAHDPSSHQVLERGSIAPAE